MESDNVMYEDTNYHRRFVRTYHDHYKINSTHISHCPSDLGNYTLRANKVYNGLFLSDHLKSVVYVKINKLSKPIHADASTNAIQFHFNAFSESISYVPAGQGLFVTTYRQKRPLGASQGDSQQV